MEHFLQLIETHGKKQALKKHSLSPFFGHYGGTSRTEVVTHYTPLLPIADLQISKSPMGLTKKSGEAL